MSDQEINIAIAEACGWAEIDGLSAKGLMGKPPGKLCSFDYLPDYCNDLKKVITDLILERDQAREVLREIEAARWHTACELRRIATRALGNLTIPTK